MLFNIKYFDILQFLTTLRVTVTSVLSRCHYTQTRGAGQCRYIATVRSNWTDYTYPCNWIQSVTRATIYVNTYIQWNFYAAMEFYIILTL